MLKLEVRSDKLEVPPGLPSLLNTYYVIVYDSHVISSRALEPIGVLNKFCSVLFILNH